MLIHFSFHPRRAATRLCDTCLTIRLPHITTPIPSIPHHTDRGGVCRDHAEPRSPVPEEDRRGAPQKHGLRDRRLNARTHTSDLVRFRGRGGSRERGRVCALYIERNCGSRCRLDCRISIIVERGQSRTRNWTCFDGAPPRECDNCKIEMGVPKWITIQKRKRNKRAKIDSLRFIFFLSLRFFFFSSN